MWYGRILNIAGGVFVERYRESTFCSPSLAFDRIYELHLMSEMILSSNSRSKQRVSIRDLLSDDRTLLVGFCRYTDLFGWISLEAYSLSYFGLFSSRHSLTQPQFTFVSMTIPGKKMEKKLWPRLVLEWITLHWVDAFWLINYWECIYYRKSLAYSVDALTDLSFSFLRQFPFVL